MIVWLASYPRSGNTFLRIILNRIFDRKSCSLHGDRHDIGADENTANLVGHQYLPADFDFEQARESSDLMFIKTHGLPPLGSEKDLAIYLVRDGRECTLSFAKHQSIYGGQNKKLIDIIYGNCFAVTWGEHINAWAPDKRPNTLLIRFEELVADPAPFIGKISDLTGLQPAKGELPSFEELHRMNPRFFRQGKTDSWKKAFSDDDHLAFWMINHRQMVDSGYGKEIPEALGMSPENELARALARQGSYIIHLLSDSRRSADKEKSLHRKIGNLEEILFKVRSQLGDYKLEAMAKNQTVRDQEWKIKKLGQDIKGSSIIIEKKKLMIQKLHDTAEKERQRLDDLEHQLHKVDQSRILKIINVFSPIFKKDNESGEKE